MVSRDIRRILTQRAHFFNIVLDDVSITNLTFSRDYTAAVEAKQVAQQDAERAKFVVCAFFPSFSFRRYFGFIVCPLILHAFLSCLHRMYFFIEHCGPSEMMSWQVDVTGAQSSHLLWGCSGSTHV